MSEANKELVRRYFAAGNAGSGSLMLAMLDRDCFHFQCHAAPPIGYGTDYDGLSRLVDGTRQTFSAPLQMSVEQMTAEEDRVAVIARSRAPLISGGEYRNDYHFLFTIRDGKISRIDEYLCTLTMSKLLDSSAVLASRARGD